MPVNPGLRGKSIDLTVKIKKSYLNNLKEVLLQQVDYRKLNEPGAIFVNTRKNKHFQNDKRKSRDNDRIEKRIIAEMSEGKK